MIRDTKAPHFSLKRRGRETSLLRRRRLLPVARGNLSRSISGVFPILFQVLAADTCYAILCLTIFRVFLHFYLVFEW